MTHKIPMLLALMIIFGSSFGAAAQLQQGQTVAPVAEIPLRASPPGSFFQGKGQEIGIVHPDSAYFVLSLRTVSTFAGSEQWVELRSNDGSTGWAFAGPSGSLSNFRPAGN